MIVLTKYHLGVLHDHQAFAQHLIVTYTLTILALSSVFTIIIRDPGRPPVKKGINDDSEELEFTQALLADDIDINSPGKWCRKCWAPKPERTHQYACNYILPHV